MYNVTVNSRTQAVQEAHRPRWALYKLTAKMIHDHEDMIDNQFEAWVSPKRRPRYILLLGVGVGG